jgi:5,6-dimethylbenzimidazole synthase
VDEFGTSDIESLHRIMAARRDMRHFLPEPLDEALVTRLLRAAHLGPSVGLMQPWRFIRVRSRSLRAQVHALVERERRLTARALKEREDEFMRLKVEGVRECGELLVAGLMPGRERFIFGRRTMPDMDLASVACAIQNLWLAARVEAVGMGWVSLFDPEELRALLRMPEGSRPVAILCLGRVPAFYSRPMLEQEHWAQRRHLHQLVMDDYWSEAAASAPNGESTAVIQQQTDADPACEPARTKEMAAGQAGAEMTAPAPVPVSR